MIRLVEVKGYECLRDIRQPLLPFHIFVGPNASGKSTFLAVVLFVRDLGCPPLRGLRPLTAHEVVPKGLLNRRDEMRKAVTTGPRQSQEMRVGDLWTGLP